MQTPTLMDQRHKSIVITLDARPCPAWAWPRPQPGAAFTLTARPAPATPSPRPAGPAQVSFELYPERLEPRMGQAQASAFPGAPGAAQAPGAQAPGGADGGRSSARPSSAACSRGTTRP
jgi:hypothetical protein